MPRGRKTIYDRRYLVLVECLRAARQAAKVTQAELAERLGSDQTYVSKYEHAERRVDVIELRAICVALGLDFISFVEDFERALKEQRLA